LWPRYTTSCFCYLFRKKQILLNMCSDKL